MSDAAKQLKEVLKDQPDNPLRSHQVEAFLEEARRLKAIVQAPHYVTGINRGLAAKKAREVEQTIETQITKPVSDDQRDLIAKLATEVAEKDIRPAMLTREEMWRNPAGAVGLFMKREQHPITKAAVRLWKRAMLTIEPQSQDPDTANIERLRPQKNTTGTATFMAEAQIPGNFAMSAQAKENWPLGEPTVDTVVKQAERVERHALTGKKKIS